MVLLLTLISSSSLAVEPAVDDHAALAFRDTLERMTEAVSGLHDLKMTFYQREWVNGAFGTLKTIEVKWRREEDLVLQYVGDTHPGRVVIWRGLERDQGKIRVDPGRFLPAMSLAFDGMLATRGNRHTIRDLPVTKLARRIIDGALAVNDHPVWKPQVVDLGPSTVRGEATHCFDTRTPKDEDPSLYAYRVKVCVNPNTALPNSVRVWDLDGGEVRLVEEYDYIGTQVNVGLTDEDFSWDTYGL